MKRSNIIVGFFLLGVLGCAPQARFEPKVEYYPVSYRQLPPEIVYSRVSWSHLPKPMAVRTQESSSYLMPEVSIELENSTLQEAVEAIAQSVGYEGFYPAQIASRPVSLKRDGTLIEILQDIAGQANVTAEIDHQKRVLRVYEHTVKRPSGQQRKQLSNQQLY